MRKRSLAPPDLLQELLRDKLQSLRKPNRLVLFPGADHRLPNDEVKTAVLSFLTEQVGSVCGNGVNSARPISHQTHENDARLP